MLGEGANMVGVVSRVIASQQFVVKIVLERLEHGVHLINYILHPLMLQIFPITVFMMNIAFCHGCIFYRMRGGRGQEL